MKKQMHIAMSMLPTYSVDIILKFSENRYDNSSARYIADAIDICEEYCNNNKLLVTIKRNEFSSHNKFSGLTVSINQYPRYPKTKNELFDAALELGSELLNTLNDREVFVIDSERTVMLEHA